MNGMSSFIDGMRSGGIAFQPMVDIYYRNKQIELDEKKEIMRRQDPAYQLGLMKTTAELQGMPLEADRKARDQAQKYADTVRQALPDNPKKAGIVMDAYEEEYNRLRPKTEQSIPQIQQPVQQEKPDIGTQYNQLQDHGNQTFIDLTRKINEAKQKGDVETATKLSQDRMSLVSEAKLVKGFRDSFYQAPESLAVKNEKGEDVPPISGMSSLEKERDSNVSQVESERMKGEIYAPLGSPIVDANQIEKGLSGRLKGYGNAFVDIGLKYGIDPATLSAMAMHETGGGTSRALIQGQNAMGISGAGGVQDYSGKGGVEASIEAAAQSIMSRPEYEDFRKTGTLADLQKGYSPTQGATNDPRNLNRFWQKGVANYYNRFNGQPTVQQTAFMMTPSFEETDSEMIRRNRQSEEKLYNELSGVRGSIQQVEQDEQARIHQENQSKLLKQQTDQEKLGIDRERLAIQKEVLDLQKKKSVREQIAELERAPQEQGISQEEIYDYGVPINAPNPYKGLSPKKAEEVRASFEKLMDKESLKNKDNLRDAQDAINSLDRFVSLNLENETGGIKGTAKTWGALGLRGSLDVGYGEMESIAEDLRLKKTQILKGAITEKEQEFARKATVNTGLSVEANSKRAEFIKGMYQRVLDKSEFEENYASAHKTLRGANEAWNEYMQAVPYVDVSSGKLNPNYLSYKDYFRMKNEGRIFKSEKDINTEIPSGTILLIGGKLKKKK